MSDTAEGVLLCWQMLGFSGKPLVRNLQQSVHTDYVVNKLSFWSTTIESELLKMKKIALKQGVLEENPAAYLEQ